MNYKKLLNALFISGIFIFTSCSKSSVTADEAAMRLVAFDEPAFISSMEVKELLDKGGITTKENIPMIAQMLFSDKVEYMSNPEKIGLDLTGKTYMAMSGGDKGMTGWAITKIKDVEKLEKMLKEEGNEKFDELEGYKTIVEKDQVIVAWNESLLIMMFDQSKNVKEVFKKYAAALNEEKKPSKSFQKFFDQKADFALMYNYKKFLELQKSLQSQYGGGSQKDMEMVNKLTKKMDGSYSIFSCSFENDKVIVDFANELTEGLKKEMNFFSKEGLPKELLAHVGSNDVSGFVSMNGNIKAYIDWIIKFSAEKDIFAQAQEETGMDVMRMLKSLKGNVLLSFLGFVPKEISYIDMEGNESKYTTKIPSISVVTTLSDNYIETVADSMFKDKKTGNYFTSGSEFERIYVAFKPGILFYTNNEDLLKNPLANANPNLDPEAVKALEKPVAYYFNLNKIIGGADNSELSQKIASKFKYTYGGMDINGGHAELILNNNGKNSLWTLINLTVESTADMATQFK